MTAFEGRYSGVDRLVHDLAMRQLEMQKWLSRLEDRSFDRSHPEIAASNPVFITSLPRAGTTLMLQFMANVPEFATHTYRNMPFLLCPILWNRLSAGFHRRAALNERAHGDGMLVGYDSAEAFEETLWRAFWPAHFERERIHPWSLEDEDGSVQFADFLRQHMRKIIALGRRSAAAALPQRYVSKNNANIARLAWLERHFPDATILIPYRDPLSQIVSVMRQHERFLKVQAAEPFVLRYMDSIGHFEFGKGLRPIDFAGWLAGASDLDASSPDFWAEYWIVVFDAILRTAGPRVTFFSYDRLCAAPKAGLEFLESRLGIAAGPLVNSASRLRSATRHKPVAAISPDRIRRLEETAAKLDERALF